MTGTPDEMPPLGYVAPHGLRSSAGAGTSGVLTGLGLAYSLHGRCKARKGTRAWRSSSRRHPSDRSCDTRPRIVPRGAPLHRAHDGRHGATRPSKRPTEPPRGGAHPAPEREAECEPRSDRRVPPVRRAPGRRVWAGAIFSTIGRAGVERFGQRRDDAARRHRQPDRDAPADDDAIARADDEPGADALPEPSAGRPGGPRGPGQPEPGRDRLPVE